MHVTYKHLNQVCRYFIPLESRQHKFFSYKVSWLKKGSDLPFRKASGPIGQLSGTDQQLLLGSQTLTLSAENITPERLLQAAVSKTAAAAHPIACAT